MKQKIIITLLLLFIAAITTSAQNLVDTVIGIDINAAADYKLTAHRLCDDVELERKKANAIFNWITHNINYDIEATKNPNRPRITASETFATRSGNAYDIALLFVKMCKEANLNAIVIEGYTREWFYDKGDMLMLPHHAWNAVQINGKWELADAAFGAGYVALNKSKRKQDKLSEDNLRFWIKYSSCFMQDPQTFRTTHLPADPMWQLTEHTMPIDTFEYGTQAVEQYNKKYIFDIKRDDPELLHIAQMDDKERINDYAKRVYDYNANFISVQGYKESVEAGWLIDRYNKRDNRQHTFIETLELAKAKLNKALGYHKEQYKLFKPYYDELEKKSVMKNKESRNDTRKLRPIDRQNALKCAGYRNTGLKNATAYETKSKNAKERIKYLLPDSITRIKTMKPERNAADADMRRLVDSVNVRTTKINTLIATLDKLEFDVIGKASENYERLQQWVHNLTVADSFMQLELSLRKKMFDNNDTEIIVCQKAFREARYGTTDSLLKYQLLNYDTVSKIQQTLLGNYVQLMNLYKSNIKDMEQYKRYISADTPLAGRYPPTVQQYCYIVDRYCELINSYADFEKQNAEQYGLITDMYDKEMSTLDYIDLAEGVRHASEQLEIAEHRAFDEQVCQNDQANIINIIKEIDQLIAEELAKQK